MNKKKVVFNETTKLLEIIDEPLPLTNKSEKNRIGVILTSAVIAAVLTSIVNITIAIMSSNQIRELRDEQYISEIITYRYTNLYDIIKNWEDWEDMPEYNDEKRIGEYAQERILCQFLDNFGQYGRYEKIRPLLDEEFRVELDALGEYGNNLIVKLVSLDTSAEEYERAIDEFNENYLVSGELLRKTIQEQLDKLISKK